MIAAYLEEPVKALYNTALPKNPNQTYGSVLSPNAIQTLAISLNPNLQTQLLQDGLITAEQIKQIQEVAPKIKERINTYNIPPISYTLEEREPDIYEQMILDKQEKERRQIEHVAVYEKFGICEKNRLRTMEFRKTIRSGADVRKSCRF